MKLLAVVLLMISSVVVKAEIDLIANNLTLSPLNAREIARGQGGNLAFDHGEYPVGLATLNPVLLNTKVQRRINKLWSMMLINDQNSAQLKVSYQLIAINGREGYMSHALSPMDQVKVDIRPLPLNIKSRVDSKVVEGGINMQIHFGDIRRAGNYSGNLRIKVTYL